MVPDPFTFRQLLDMREFKLQQFWQPFAVLTALTYNINRGKNKKPMKPEEVNPFIPKKQERTEVVRDNKIFLDAMKALFIKDK